MTVCLTSEFNFKIQSW